MNLNDLLASMIRPSILVSAADRQDLLEKHFDRVWLVLQCG